MEDSLVARALKGSFLRFAAVGLLSTIIQFVVLNIVLYLSGPLWLAAGLGYFAGFMNGYILNSRYVFQNASLAIYGKYLLVWLGGLGITEIIVQVVHQAGYSENKSSLVAVVIVFFWNYFLCKNWVFRHP